MKFPYVIIFDPNSNEELVKKFTEIVRSVYVSKVAKNHLMIIAVEKKIDPKEIHKRLAEKIGLSFSFVVVTLESFYGSFSDEVVKWFKDTFPEKEFVA